MKPLWVHSDPQVSPQPDELRNLLFNIAVHQQIQRLHMLNRTVPTPRTASLAMTTHKCGNEVHCKGGFVLIFLHFHQPRRERRDGD